MEERYKWNEIKLNCEYCFAEKETKTDQYSVKFQISIFEHIIFLLERLLQQSLLSWWYLPEWIYRQEIPMCV